MKKTMALLCVWVLLLTVVLSATGMSASAAPARKGQTLYHQILERDGFIEGIWYPWFTHDYLGCGLTANETAGKWITNPWYDFGKVGIDAYGADKIYTEIYNLKALGYNMLAIAGSAYGEGVIFDDNGDVLGIKQDYLQNTRRFLDICREVGMPVMWNICFHSSSIPGYYGSEAWNIICRKYGDPTVADHYAQRFVRPLCKVLGEYDDVVALIALTDEVENEINDSNIPNASANKAYGTTKEKVLYFVTAMNEVVAEELPQIARTVAANSNDLGMYCELQLDVMGRNRYSDEGTVPDPASMYASAPMLLTEYNLYQAKSMNEEQYSAVQIKFREEMKKEGYQGGFQWCWQPNAKGGAMDMLRAAASSKTDFRTAMYDRYYYTLDARNAHQGKSPAMDTPVTFYYTGNGLLEWIPSRQGKTVTIQRSLNSGKTWQDLVTDQPLSRYVKNDRGQYQDTAAHAMALYRVLEKDGEGHSALSAATNTPGAATEHIGESPSVTITKEWRPAFKKVSSVDFTGFQSLSLSSFGTHLNRPYIEKINLIDNAGFEKESGGQWNNRTFLNGQMQVVTDPTAPEGNKSLHFDTRDTDTPVWHTFSVAVQPNTDYTLSAWVKGAYISDDNRFYSSLGVVNPSTGGFATFSEYQNRQSRTDRQIYPPAWDNDWHLRSVTFKSGDNNQVVIGMYGCASEMWVDGLALYHQGGGVSYLSEISGGNVSFSYDYDHLRCDPDKSLTENLRFDEPESTYWQSGGGWDNGFMSLENTSYGYGVSMKYTASAHPAGLSYIKWIPVEKETEYIVTFNYKVLKEGEGYIRLAVKRGEGISSFVTVSFVGAQRYEGADGWCTFSTKLDTDAFDAIALVVTDLGGEALIDNVRLFLPQDGSDVSDRPGDTPGTTGSTGTSGTTVPVVRPTITNGSTAAPTLPTDPTDPLPPTTGAEPSTDPTAAEPLPTLPTGTDPTAPDPTAPSQDAEGIDAEGPSKPLNTVVLWVVLGAVLLLVIGGGVLWLWKGKKNDLKT